MFPRIFLVLLAALLTYVAVETADACCAVSVASKPVVNADQTVIIIWDKATKTQHFIRKASFKSEADDFGFLVPSPTQPELSESGNEAFPHLGKLTEPHVITIPRALGGGCGCSAATREAPAAGHGLWSVKVLEEKVVAGFHAAVLESNSSAELVKWLKDNGYHFSPEVETWAKPYVDAGWKITAMKIAKDKDEKSKQSVAASALRMTFKTDRPLFPYREPDYKNNADKLGAKKRLLRIFFIAEARYEGEMKQSPWSGKVVWAGKVGAEERKKLLEELKLPETTGPAQWWLTEFEDNWSYKLAPGDVYFSPSKDQGTVRRPTETRYASASYPNDASAYALAMAMIVPPLWLRVRRFALRRE